MNRIICVAILVFAPVSVFAEAAGVEDIFDLSPGPEERGVPPGWSFSDGPEFPGAAGDIRARDGIVELHFDFRDGGGYVAAYREIDPPRPLDRLYLRMKKPATAAITVRAVDSAGQTFQKGSAFVRDGWEQIEVDLTHWHHFFGGPGDGRMRHPIRQVGILVERDGLREPEGVVQMAEVRAREIPEEEALAIAGEVDSFRSVYTVTGFREHDGFSISGPGELREGIWRVDLAQAESASLHNSISLHGRPKELKLTVRGGAAGHRLRLHLGSHFQVFVRDLGELTGGSETFIVPAPPEGWDHYGGQDDGEVRPPLRFSRLEALRADGPAEAVELELEKLECVTEVTATSGLILEPSLVDDTGMDGSLRLVAERRNLLPKVLDGVLEVIVRDWSGRTLFEVSVDDRLAPGRAAPKEWVVPFPGDRNFVEASVRYIAGGEALAGRTACRTRSLDREPDRKLRPESPWGMGVYLYRYPDTPEGLERMEAAASMASRAGVQWSREEFSWHRIEVEPGVYDFSYYDKVVDTAARNGIAIYGLLAYWSQWTQPYTEQGIEDFASFTRAVVRRYRDRIRHWEIYNEPNIFFWQGPKELYPELLKRCFEVVREEDPGAKVLGISTAGIDLSFIRMCLEAEAPFDILTVHPYRGYMNEAQFMAELEAAAELVGGRPVWITEMGLPTHLGGLSERNQALFLSRAYLAAVTSGAAQNISWYNFRNDGTDPFYNEHNFGVLRHDLSPKASYRAAATISLGLRDGPWEGETLAPDLYALRARDALAIWSGEGAATVSFEASPEARVYNLMGERVDLARRGGRVEMELPPFAPLFVLGGEVGEIDAGDRPERSVFRF